MIKKIVFTLITGLGITISTFAQDPEFSQFYAAPIYLNPALAGSAGVPRIGLNYRNQWPGLNAFTTYAASYDQLISKINSGVGLFVMQDNQGDGVYTNTQIELAYNYNIRLGNTSVLKPALKLTFMNSSFNNANLIYRYQSNGSSLEPQNASASGETVQPGSKSNFDAGIGGIIATEIAFAGVAVDHLLQPNIAYGTSTSTIPTKITAHAGANLPVGGRSSGSSFSPNVLFQTQGTASQLNVGFYYGFNALVVGAWYRYVFKNSDAFIPLVGLKLGKFRVGYSYDLGLSEIRSASGGAHEVSLSLDLNNPKKKSKQLPWSRINCPTF